MPPPPVPCCAARRGRRRRGMEASRQRGRSSRHGQATECPRSLLGGIEAARGLCYAQRGEDERAQRAQRAIDAKRGRERLAVDGHSWMSHTQRAASCRALRCVRAPPRGLGASGARARARRGYRAVGARASGVGWGGAARQHAAYSRLRGALLGQSCGAVQQSQTYACSGRPNVPANAAVVRGGRGLQARSGSCLVLLLIGGSAYTQYMCMHTAAALSGARLGHALREGGEFTHASAKPLKWRLWRRLTLAGAAQLTTRYTSTPCGRSCTIES